MSLEDHFSDLLSFLLTLNNHDVTFLCLKYNMLVSTSKSLHFFLLPRMLSDKSSKLEGHDYLFLITQTCPTHYHFSTPQLNSPSHPQSLSDLLFYLSLLFTKQKVNYIFIWFITIFLCLPVPVSQLILNTYWFNFKKTSCKC